MNPSGASSRQSPRPYPRCETCQRLSFRYRYALLLLTPSPYRVKEMQPLLQSKFRDTSKIQRHSCFCTYISRQHAAGIYRVIHFRRPFSFLSHQQSCLKVANEAPADLRSNLQRSWAMFDQEKLDSCTAATEYRACLFGLCFFHSLVLGRRRFGQLGWSRSYGFSAGDLNICANILQSYWEVAVSAAGRGAPWQELRYIFGEIMYGGHITDFFDRRVTISYLEVRLRALIFSKPRTIKQ